MSTSGAQPCLFCAIVIGTATASRVFEDKHTIAFLDVQPATTGHLLVLPKAHATGVDQLTGKQAARLFRVAHRLTRAIRASAVSSDGMTLFLADGAAAGQEVFHVHLHVIPRSAGDGLRSGAVWAKPPRAELERVAALIRAGLAALPAED